MMRKSPLKRSAPLRQRAPMKRSRPIKKKARRKIAGHHDKPMLDACRGEPCYLGVVGVCLGEAGRPTVVPCHSNDSAHGKGMGIKAADRFSVPGCMACHAWLDQGTAARESKRAVFEDALSRWVPVRARKLTIKERK